MSSKSKLKGSRFEREVADYLALTMPGVDRKALRGNHDHGDIANVPGFTLECKSTRELNLAAAIDEAQIEAFNANTPWFAAVVKRRNRGVAASYVVITLEEFALLHALFRGLARRAEGQNPAPRTPKRAAPPKTG